jgi:hypothetical protein
MEDGCQRALDRYRRRKRPWTSWRDPRRGGRARPDLGVVFVDERELLGRKKLRLNFKIWNTVRTSRDRSSWVPQWHWNFETECWMNYTVCSLPGTSAHRSSVAQWQSIRLLTGGLLVRVQPEEPSASARAELERVMARCLAEARRAKADHPAAASCGTRPVRRATHPGSIPA